MYYINLINSIQVNLILILLKCILIFTKQKVHTIVLKSAKCVLYIMFLKYLGPLDFEEYYASLIKLIC